LRMREMRKPKTSGRPIASKDAKGSTRDYFLPCCSLSRQGGVRQFIWMSLALLLAVSFLWAKQKPPATKTISGAVLDGSQNGISGATILLTDLRTHQNTAIFSGAKGAYQFSGLDPTHDYQLQAKYKGTTSDIREVSSLDARMHIVINLVLAPPNSAGTSAAP